VLGGSKVSVGKNPNFALLFFALCLMVDLDPLLMEKKTKLLSMFFACQRS
jgi:hypothetical protein